MPTKRVLVPAACVLATSLLTFVALLFGTYRLGRTSRPAAPIARFLSPLAPPTTDESCLAIVGDSAVKMSDEPNAVVFLGDSACRFDVDPLAIEKATGVRCYNFGTIATAGPAVLNLIAQRYLASHPKPRAIIVCLSPMSLGYDAFLDPGSLNFRFVDAYGNEPQRFPAATNDAVDFVRYFARRGAIELTQGPPGAVLELPMIGDPEHSFRFAEKATLDGRGHITLPGEHGPGFGGLRGWWGFPPLARDWLGHIDSLISTCEASDIRVRIRLAPLREDMQQVWDFTPYRNWIDDVKSRHPSAVLDPAMTFYESSLCWDQTHLNAAGVAKFMPVVAKDVQAVLAERRGRGQ
jgi:hypothetical protein